MADNKYDFSGWATKTNIVCTDGRTIAQNAFKHMDGKRVPLVWRHLQEDPSNVLGFGILEAKPEGVIVHGKFNGTDAGKTAKELVLHGDIDSLSIFANRLIEKNKLVHDGQIIEVSLVVAGANPGAKITNVSFQHGDETIDSEDEVIIELGVSMAHEDKSEEVSHAEDVSDDDTLAEVFNGFSEEQKNVVYAMVAQLMGDEGDGSVAQSDNSAESNSEGDTFMNKNVFENEDSSRHQLTHDQLATFAQDVFNDMPKYGNFRDAFLAHAGTYGIDNISYLFPDAQTLDSEPSFLTRRMGWVPGWMASTRHTPFSRIKKLWADLTPDAARAKGYITGNEKVEQVFALLKRTTEPTTIYKKQKLDRDDLSDISGTPNFDVVAWMWREMRFMLDEEVARAALVGDGRTFGTDDDAIDPSKIRPIYGDATTFVHYLTLPAATTDYLDIIDAIQVARVNYKGTGTPNFYTTNAVLTGMLLLKDTTNRRIYKSVAELASDLRVAEIIEVEVLEGVQRTDPTPVTGFTADLMGIMVNPYDYTYGADKGGQIATFDQFDIDYNQQKYLIETRLSGSLLNPKSALVVERKTA